MLPPSKMVIAFLLRFVFVLTVCLMPWPRLEEVYGSAVAAVGNALVGDRPVGSGAFLRFDSPPKPHRSDPESKPTFQAELSARSTKTGSVVRVPIDLRTLTFIPTVVFVALAIAAPIWKGARGPIVLVSGLVILQLFLAGSIAVPLLLFFSNPRPMQLFQLSPAVGHGLDVAYRSLVAPPGMAFAIPGLLWLALLWLIPYRHEKLHEPLASETAK